MNTSKTLLVSTAVVLAITLVLAPLAISEDTLAKKSNKAKQIIEQSQKSKQNSQVVSGGSSSYLVITLTSKTNPIKATML